MDCVILQIGLNQITITKKHDAGEPWSKLVVEVLRFGDKDGEGYNNQVHEFVLS